MIIVSAIRYCALRPLGRAWVLDFDLECAREPGDRLVSGRGIRAADWASLPLLNGGEERLSVQTAASKSR